MPEMHDSSSAAGDPFEDEHNGVVGDSSFSQDMDDEEFPVIPFCLPLSMLLI